LDQRADLPVQFLVACCPEPEWDLLADAVDDRKLRDRRAFRRPTGHEFRLAQLEFRMVYGRVVLLLLWRLWMWHRVLFRFVFLKP